TSLPGGFSGTSAGPPVVVNGLANGTAYTFTVVATNALGSGQPSAASNSATPQATRPDPPTITAAIPGSGTLVVAFAPPASNGGSAITGYTVTCRAGATSIEVAGSAPQVVVGGLSNGTQYDCFVVATNAIGTSIPSAAFPAG